MGFGGSRAGLLATFAIRDISRSRESREKKKKNGGFVIRSARDIVGERQPYFVQEIARESYIGQKGTSEQYISLLETPKQNGYSIKNI